jgi:serine/threonine protein kinase/WD40 repeat protein/type II secretory pathway predicted ATPase ExeA
MVERIGQQVGNYRLVKLLGVGGFAEVYLGEHHILKSYAALKFLKVALSNKETRQFVFEGQTLVRLRHRHIVRALDFSMDRGHPVLITDYISGGSLRSRHERKAILPLDLVVNYVKQISMALQYAHNQHVIHRDIKPENILIDADQQLCLSDFGLAIFAPSSSALSLNVEGTLLYMAPEQVQGRPTFASDQYSLGIMVYEWLCGNRPFSGSQFELMSAHLYAEPQPLREVCPELPEEVEKVVLRALAKDPQQRYVSVQAFAQALERASEEQIQGNAITDMLQKKPFQASLAISSEPPLQRKLFIAAAPEDGAFVEQLGKDLRQHNVDFSHDLRAPLKQEEPLREAIRAAYLVCLIASPHMRGSQEVQNYLRIALLYKRRLVLVWASGESVASSLLDLSGRTRPPDVIDARKERYATALEEIIDCLREDTGITPIVATSLTSLTEEPRNPYKGLRAFTRDDASDFFGRDALIQRTLGVLDNMLDVRQSLQRSQRLLSVVGPSGSGKSSLVMAGLLPKLQRGALPGSENWCYLDPLLPGQHPCEALLALLAQQFPKKNSADVRNVLVAEQGYGLYQLASYLSRPNNRRVVLCIDQFEEIFALGVPEPERQHFLRLLINAVTEPQSPVIVILTLRADFYDRPMHYRELALLIEANQVSVLPMDNQELRAAIENPAYQGDVQLLFEGDLVGDLLFELQGQSNALPLLEFTLEQLFEQRQELILTQEAYKAIGGLRGALARHAEDVYIRLASDQERVLARTLFLRLIDPGKSELDTTRRRAALSELLLENDEQTLVLSNVAHTFIDARLLTTNAIAGITSIEVSHEALIREWPRLATWLHEAREDIILQHNIATDAADWLKHDKAEDRLYRGIQLQESLQWMKRQIANVSEVAFIQASQLEQKSRDEEDQRRLGRELTLKRQTVQRLRAFLITISVLLIVSLVSGGVFVGLSGTLYTKVNDLHIAATAQALSLQTSQALALSANSNANLSQEHLDLALLLADAASRTQESVETRNTLLNALEQYPQIVKIVSGVSSIDKGLLAIDPEARFLVYANRSSISIQDSTSQKPTLSFQPGNVPVVDGMTLSPNGHFVAVANNEGLWLWDMQKQTWLPPVATFPIIVPANAETPMALAFSPDGQQLVLARCSQSVEIQQTLQCNDIQVATWDMHTKQPLGKALVIPLTADPDTLALSPDAHYLATSNGNVTQVWSILTDQPVPTVIQSAAPVNRLAFSSDSSMLAISTVDNTIHLWNRSTGQPEGTPQLTGNSDTITDLAFSSDDQVLASSGLDKTVRLWDLTTGQSFATLNADNQKKYSVAFSADGKILISGSGDGTLLLWNYKPSNPLSHTLASTLPGRSPLFSRDGSHIFFGTQNGKIESLSLKPGSTPSVFLDTTTAYPLSAVAGGNVDYFSVHSLALDKSGHLLAAGRLDGEILIIDLSTRQVIAQFHLPQVLDKVQLSDDGRILVADDVDGTIMLWDVAKNVLLHTFTKKQDNLAPLPVFALKPDGTSLSLGICKEVQGNPCAQQQIQTWSIPDNTLIHVSSPMTSISFLAFSPDNRTLAGIVTASPDSSTSSLRLWDTGRADWLNTDTTMPDDQDAQYSYLCFSQSGNELVVSSSVQSPSFSFAIWKQENHAFKLFAQPISLPQFNQYDFSLSPDGQQLISIHLISTPDKKRFENGLLLTWDINSDLWQKTVCNIVQHNLSLANWAQFGGSVPYVRVCAHLPVPT